LVPVATAVTLLFSLERALNRVAPASQLWFSLSRAVILPGALLAATLPEFSNRSRRDTPA
jgi:hypothetical protein